VAGRRVWSSAAAVPGPVRNGPTWLGAQARGGTARAGIHLMRVSGPRCAITRPVVRVR
jgi:hypothetical protein